MGSGHELETIYVAIASYRDPFLNSTVKDALNKADNPKNITIGCFIQSYINERPITIPEHVPGLKFKVIEPGTIFSVNTCRTNALHFLNDSHKYVLQIDSHTRFDEGWDTKLINKLNSLDSKSIISSYCPSWYPAFLGEKEEVEVRHSTYDCYFNYNSKDKYLLYNDLVPFLEAVESDNELYKGWYLCAHFIFSKSEYFKQRVLEDWVMFWGEELLSSLSAASNGWSVYIPKDSHVYHLFPQDVEAYINLPKIFKDYPEIFKEKSEKTTGLIIDMLSGEAPMVNLTKEGLEKINSHLGYDLAKTIVDWRREKRGY